MNVNVGKVLQAMAKLVKKSILAYHHLLLALLTRSVPTRDQPNILVVVKKNILGMA
jgi:hypothetical protein